LDCVGRQHEAFHYSEPVHLAPQSIKGISYAPQLWLVVRTVGDDIKPIGVSVASGLSPLIQTEHHGGVVVGSSLDLYAADLTHTFRVDWTDAADVKATSVLVIADVLR